MSLAYQREFTNPESYIPEKCCYCDQEIQMFSQAVKLKNCSHEVHKTCLNDIMEIDPSSKREMFDTLNQCHVNKCKACHKPILEGYEEALKIKP